MQKHSLQNKHLSPYIVAACSNKVAITEYCNGAQKQQQATLFLKAISHIQIFVIPFQDNIMVEYKKKTYAPALKQLRKNIKFELFYVKWLLQCICKFL